MHIVTMRQAKTNLSRLVNAIEDGRDSEIFIARNGKLVAKLVAINGHDQRMRIGVAKGQFVIHDSIDLSNVEVAQFF